jgi:hypothetical protein
MKLVVCGSRDCDDYQVVVNHLKHMTTIEEIVSGCARGADKLGERYAEENNIPLKKMPADWKRWGKSAGYIRNEDMAEYARYVICFWDGKSPGSKGMIKFCRENEIPILVIKYNENNLAEFM